MNPQHQKEEKSKNQDFFFKHVFPYSAGRNPAQALQMLPEHFPTEPIPNPQVRK